MSGKIDRKKWGQLFGFILIVTIMLVSLDEIIDSFIEIDGAWHLLIDTLIIGLTSTILFYIYLKKINKYEQMLEENKEITEELNTKNQALTKSEERYRHLLDISPNAVTVHANGKFLYINKAAMKLLCANSPEELIGKSVFDVLPPEYHEMAKKRLQAANDSSSLQPIQYPLIRLEGVKIYVETTLAKIDYMGQEAYLSVTTDITERRDMEGKLQYMAYYDQLTGLPNRYMLNDYLKKSLARCKRNLQKLAVMFLDLDRFKFINDTEGHDAGDALLTQVKDRLVGAVRESDIVGRIGGDEFIIVLENVEKPQVIKIAERIISTFTNPFIIRNQEFYISPSIGISIYPDHAQSGETLIKSADSAMYVAKKRGKNTYQFFDHEPETVLDRKIKLENGLRKAIDQNEFTLFYQPQFDLLSGKIKGVEALLRWKHPEYGYVSPAEFIPIAEETGMIIPIGKWVIQSACKQNKKWLDQGIILRMAINVSPLQLENPGFLESVKQVLHETKLPPELLELEITESIMQNFKVASEVIQELKRLGIKISVDDFGTGYSSLNVLNRLPIDFVKIDKSFIDEIPANNNTASLVKMIIDMGGILKFDLIAEGIEKGQQSDFLRQNGCRYGQGYLYSPPLEAEKVEELLSKQLVKV